MTPPNFHHLVQKAKDFTLQQLNYLKENDLLQSFNSIDHICYRVENLESYELWKTEIKSYGVLLSEAYINGRPICTFKLKTPIRINAQYSIELLELPAPKDDQFYAEGLEHIEVVTNCSLEEILSLKHHLSFNTGNLDAKINRDISLKSSHGVIKFHESSLEEIIGIEKKILEQNRQSKQSKVLLIDFDETLVDSQNQFLQASHAAIQEFLNQEIPQSNFILKMRPTFPEFLAQFDITSEQDIHDTITIFQKKCLELKDLPQIPTGIESALSCLWHEGVQISIWTARDTHTARLFIESSPLKCFINEIVGYDTKTSSKPLVSEKIQSLIKNAKTLVVGDSLSDRDGATNIGASFLQASWVKNKELEVEDHFICQTPFQFLHKAIRIFQ